MAIKKKENEKKIKCIFINGLRGMNYADFNETALYGQKEVAITKMKRGQI